MRKILFITGTRADFSKLKSLMHIIESSHDFELHVLVTGMHMMPSYGSTHIEVSREKFKHTYLIANQFMGEPMASVMANTLNIISRLTDSINPDMLVVHGDRVEAFAGAIAGALNHIRVCHIEGGELSGTIDDSIRHSISKLAHIHLVANEDAQNRLLQMGERLDTIFIIGSPDLDVMSSNSLPSLDIVKDHYDIHFSQYAVMMFHPVTSEYNLIQTYAENLLQALAQTNKNYIIIFPNNDKGSIDILNVIAKYKNHSQFLTFPSINFECFLTLLKNCEFIIGNSSAGIREAPYYEVPTINIGTRQNNRSFEKSIINTNYQINNILEAINDITHIKCQPSSKFGTGNSTEIFQSIIKEDSFWDIATQKVFMDRY